MKKYRYFVLLLEQDKRGINGPASRMQKSPCVYKTPKRGGFVWRSDEFGGFSLGQVKYNTREPLP